MVGGEGGVRGSLVEGRSGERSGRGGGGWREGWVRERGRSGKGEMERVGEGRGRRRRWEMGECEWEGKVLVGGG